VAPLAIAAPRVAVARIDHGGGCRECSPAESFFCARRRRSRAHDPRDVVAAREIPDRAA
jgi:hypothetical protein